jgi:hypothetical protein
MGRRRQHDSPILRKTQYHIEYFEIDAILPLDYFDQAACIHEIPHKVQGGRTHSCG